MMMSEFIDRTGFEPTAKEYAKIEEAYYDFDGDKDAFCKAFVKDGGARKLCKARAAEIDRLNSLLLESERQCKKDMLCGRSCGRRSPYHRPAQPCGRSSRSRQSFVPRLLVSGNHLRSIRLDADFPTFGNDPVQKNAHFFGGILAGAFDRSVMNELLAVDVPNANLGVVACHQRGRDALAQRKQHFAFITGFIGVAFSRTIAAQHSF